MQPLMDDTIEKWKVGRANHSLDIPIQNLLEDWKFVDEDVTILKSHKKSLSVINVVVFYLIDDCLMFNWMNILYSYLKKISIKISKKI